MVATGASGEIREVVGDIAGLAVALGLFVGEGPSRTGSSSSSSRRSDRWSCRTCRPRDLLSCP